MNFISPGIVGFSIAILFCIGWFCICAYVDYKQSKQVNWDFPLLGKIPPPPPPERINNKKNIKQKTMEELNNYKKNMEDFVNENSGESLKVALLGITKNNLSYAKKLYEWVLKDGKEGMLFRLGIVKLYFDIDKISARRNQDDSYLLELDDIYNWIKEKQL